MSDTEPTPTPEDEATPTTEPIEPAPPAEPVSEGGEGSGGGGGRSKAPVVVGTVVVLLLLGVAALIFLYLRGTKDSLVEVVPADADAYVTVHLDPGLQQKWQVKQLLDHFPEARAEGLGDGLERLLQPLLRGAGVDYEDDVKPWLGSQVGFYLGDLGDLSSDAPPVAVLFDTSDPEAARDFFIGFAPPGEEPLTFTERDHDGVTIYEGTGGTELSLATVGDTLILAPDGERVAETIDVSQSGNSLADDEAYQDAVGALPSRRLATVFFDIGAVRSQLPSIPFDPDSEAADETLSAFRAGAMALSADGDGVALDLAVSLDTDRLTDEQEAVLRAGAADALADRVPADAFGFVSVGGLRGLADQLDALAEGNPDARQVLDELDLDVLGDVLALEIGPGSPAPDGALLVEVTDEEGAAGLVEDLFGVVTTEGAEWTERDHDGVTIHVLSGGGAEQGVSPAYAVADGVAIVGSTLEEVERVLDAPGEGTVAGTDPYGVASDHLVDDPAAMLYVNVRGILDEVRDFLAGDARDAFDRDVAPNLRRVEALVLSSGDDGDTVVSRLFVVVADPED